MRAVWGGEASPRRTPSPSIYMKVCSRKHTIGRVTGQGRSAIEHGLLILLHERCEGQRACAMPSRIIDHCPRENSGYKRPRYATV
jgi:hypothetical protein